MYSKPVCDWARKVLWLRPAYLPVVQELCLNGARFLGPSTISLPWPAQPPIPSFAPILIPTHLRPPCPRFGLQLDFMEAVFGCNKELDISHLESCGTCSGSGVKAGTTPTTCKTCGGQGQVVQAVRTPLGMFQQVASCPTCGGSGQESTPCGTCGGDGRVRAKKRISLRVPPGIDLGSRLRVRGEGDAGKRCAGGGRGVERAFCFLRGVGCEWRCKHEIV